MHTRSTSDPGCPSRLCHNKKKSTPAGTESWAEVVDGAGCDWTEGSTHVAEHADWVVEWTLLDEGKRTLEQRKHAMEKGDKESHDYCTE
ncbi:hypothetical protein LIER_05202 [Lithospermum erythrorhizon]|uniref:Uncharacterized protein n=1 Tax=Lithospermum erythrorhizon TaxID=34254 RepID=A0AAV3P4A1_LITER